jgi:small subunit ribosomal protein S17
MAESEDTTNDEVTEPVAGESAVGDDTPRGGGAPPAAAPTADEVEQAPEAAAPEAPAEPVVVLAPKERRARARAAKAAMVPQKPERSGSERQAEREEERVVAAKARRATRAKLTAKHKSEAHNRSATPAREQVDGRQKVRQGVVVSDKADKTITVRIDVARRHRRYAKVVRTSQTFHAHDETNDAHTGDTVTIRECRPLSRSKRWRLVGVVERAK